MNTKMVPTFLLTASIAVVACAAANAAEPSAATTQAKKATAQAYRPPAQAGRPLLIQSRPIGDPAIIRTVADAMGFLRGMGRGETTNSLNRLQWRGSGKFTEGNTTFLVPSYIYTVSLYLKAAREDIQLSAPGKKDRLVRVVADQDAWDESEPGVNGRAVEESALNRRLQMARTPFGFTRALLDANASTVKIVDPGVNGKVTITLPIEGVMTTATLNSDYRPESIAMQVDGKAIVARYRDYRDLSEYGVMFATRQSETVDGKPRLDVTINDARVASYAVFPKPESLAAKR